MSSGTARATTQKRGMWEVTPASHRLGNANTPLDGHELKRNNAACTTFRRFTICHPHLRLVILSGVKDLLCVDVGENRSFASLRMTTLEGGTTIPTCFSGPRAMAVAKLQGNDTR